MYTNKKLDEKFNNIYENMIKITDDIKVIETKNNKNNAVIINRIARMEEDMKKDEIQENKLNEKALLEKKKNKNGNFSEKKPNEK